MFMSGTLEELVRETIEVTGSKLPALLESDAPVLDPAATAADDAGGFYLVGIIGGKEVGKSALVNALAGQTITASTAYGPGTEMAIAYAHASQETAVTALLNRIVPGRCRIVTHQLADLRGMVLLDLPDIDSHYREHLQTTRAVLRHLLFPVWVGSVEKYADQQPMQLLGQVAAGNSPANFIFCLNKTDQTPGAVEELRNDYAARITRTLQLEASPRVFALSATHPQDFDMPKLRGILMVQKSANALRQSKELAVQRQERSLLTWLATQELPVRARRLATLRQEAEEALSQRLGPALLERVAPQLANDPAAQLAIADEVLDERVAHWPIVNLVHTLLWPIFLIARNVVSKNAAPAQNADGLVDACLRQTDEPVSTMVQSAFGQLRRARPEVGELYANNKLWESAPADAAAAELSHRLAQTMLRQRIGITERFSKRASLLTAPLRWLLTIGAVVWFPFLQPILETALSTGKSISSVAVAALFVEVLGVNYLLKSAIFLFIWFLVLWLALRWNTQRKVARLTTRWTAAAGPDSDVSLTSQVMEWMDALLAPIRSAESRVQALAQRVEEFDQSKRKAG
jgi:hypothetical protein